MVIDDFSGVELFLFFCFVCGSLSAEEETPLFVASGTFLCKAANQCTMRSVSKFACFSTSDFWNLIVFVFPERHLALDTDPYLQQCDCLSLFIKHFHTHDQLCELRRAEGTGQCLK